MIPKQQKHQINYNCLLSPDGADVILGKNLDSKDFIDPILPSSVQMFAPRGACLVSDLTSINSSLWVADTGHHRLLGWENIPIQDNQPADWIIGQVDFESEGQNGNRGVDNNTFNVPTGICHCGEGLAVADAWNHRVLIWHKIPQGNNIPADIVLGQVNFSENQPNRGNSFPEANTLNWCYGIYCYQGQLFVADTGNRRVLIWNQLPTENGQPADVVLGQLDMISRHENGGHDPDATSMRWCHDITVWQGNLVVTDAGNNRVMIWQGIPNINNQECVAILGQERTNCGELNQGNYFPNSRSLSMPYGVDAIGNHLIVADTANSRLLIWKSPEFITDLQGAEADGLVGQINFDSKSENRDFGLPKRDSLNWCYGINVCGDNVVVVDSGNNRVLIWKIRE
ncbi:NHL repeat containing protein [Calothrix sp. PCC 6303]|uniref:NHL repeat containing protein n=1 Tax=Calothrix sp. PCC 6303 TaxID=1170562 RepID=UPI0002A026D4|nr:NHL repeat containing protein [Calothrix sp. PCC 6303]AFY99571.1 NHL repeat containing protein [Calothrix sp. PCC 6303]